MCPYPRICPCSACDTYFWAKISVSLTNKKKPWTEIILKNVQGVVFADQAVFYMSRRLVEYLVQNICQTVAGVQKLFFQERCEVIDELV